MCVVRCVAFRTVPYRSVPLVSFRSDPIPSAPTSAPLCAVLCHVGTARSRRRVVASCRFAQTTPNPNPTPDRSI
eukprot:EW704988.1.p4 GENE.EW704988.1~~EW704988.1.p4  ORF type:complete len:74 (+),score=18.43 EW704988.1:143-364(+)